MAESLIALNLFMRWLHLSSMAALVGGILHARLVSIPSASILGRESQDALADRAAGRAFPIVLVSIVGLVVSGIFTLLSMPGHTPRYHAVLGVKLLLAAHVFAVSLIATRPHNPRRARLLTGTLISGLIIVALAAYLHRIY